MLPQLWHTELGNGPLAACAIHDGHALRPEVAALLRLDDATRRYEEDPYTADWTMIAPTRIIGLRSRFEVDLNRPREKAIYQSPADAWGLDVWKSPPTPEFIARSLAEYDEFYNHLQQLLAQLVARHGHVVVFDLHSYNGRAEAGRSTAEPRENPEINLGTRSIHRGYWSRIVERWLAEMRSADYLGRKLDVRENVKFFGGHLAGWVHQHFPRTVCVLAIEVRKFFMDERTGALDATKHQAIGESLAQAAAGVRDELESWHHAAPRA